jgi:glycosyltransferase involved in cell wall biosynthesis
MGVKGNEKPRPSRAGRKSTSQRSLAINWYIKFVAEMLSVKGQVKFLGRLPYAEQFNIMARALALPIIWPEPLPSIAMESISPSVPLVGSDWGGIPEIVSNYGITTDLKPEEEAKAISTIIE